MFETVCLFGTRAGVLNTLTEHLVIRALAELRQRARLAVYLNRAALGLILEHRNHVAFVGALQHPLVPHPVEQHRSQVLGTRCRCERCTASGAAATPTLCAGRSLPTALRLRTGRSLPTGCRCHADCEDKGQRGCCPTIPSTRLHGGSPSCGVSMPIRQDELKAQS